MTPDEKDPLIGMGNPASLIPIPASDFPPEAQEPKAIVWQDFLDQLFTQSDKGWADYNPYLIMNEVAYTDLKNHLFTNPDIKLIISELYRHKLIVSQFFKENTTPVALISNFNLHLQLGQYRTMNPWTDLTIEDLLHPTQLL